MLKRFIFKYFVIIFGLSFVFACSGPKKLGLPPGANPSLVINDDTPFTIHDPSLLIGGPSAQGRVGDFLLSNSKIRVIIQKSRKNADINSFGGNIIDADHVRPQGSAGQDRWRSLFPQLNIEWTINDVNFEVIADGSDGGAKILRAYGMIDTYDYLDLDWIADAASAIVGQPITFADRFDDRRDPFRTDSNLKDLDFQVITDFTLEPDANYVRIDTTFTNKSGHSISFPFGDFLVARGELQMLIPGLGFTPQAVSQAGQSTPALIYSAFPGGDVSYGYFYDMSSFTKPKVKKEDSEQIYTTSSLTYSGVTGVLLGEEFLKVLPLGSQAAPEIHFVIPKESTKTMTRYFVVGDGSAGSVFDTGMKILKVPTATLSGQVLIGNAPVEEATIAVKKLSGGTITTYTTDTEGRFEGVLPTGESLVGKAFGAGQYEVWVEKKGYHENGTVRAGSCSPSQIDLTKSDNLQIVCNLGETGFVKLSGGVVDAASSAKIPARLTIVGQDPSPETDGAGTFSDLEAFGKPFGIVDLKYINIKGGFGLTDQNTFALEPGTYHFFFSHGPEYSMLEKEVTVSAGASINIENIVLKKVIATPGFISADFHTHSSTSPDSAYSPESRALVAQAEGLDVLQSSDHDFLTDYAPIMKDLAAKGILKESDIQTAVGQEVTPNHYGHIQAFPLTANSQDPDAGAIDWSSSPMDEISPAPDYCMSPPQIASEILKRPGGEKVVQVNHISEGAIGLPVATGWLTSPAYQKKFGVSPFVSYADPVERRLPASANKPPFPPYTMGQSELIFDHFTAVELTIDSDLHKDQLWESSLPTWFNLLNLGLTPTATANSDCHVEIASTLGMARNYLASKVDPADGLGNSHLDISEDEYAHNINQHHLVVSAGPFISMTAKNEKGEEAGVGDTIHGNAISFNIEVDSPDWAWFDTVEIYANTEPIPAEDSARFAMRGVASSPEQFAKPYHVPRYVYEPVESFRLADGSLKNWTNKDGKISAKLEVTLTVKEDTWVVVVVKGTQSTEGYRSLFPFVPNVLKDSKQPPQIFDPAKLELFHKDPKVHAPAWAFTNPIFIDVDGDTNNDSFPFEAKWVREGFSKLQPFQPYPQ